jgi:hypothetical protein
MLTLPGLDRLAIEQPAVYDALLRLLGAFNQLQQQLGVAVGRAASLPPPAPPAALEVTAARGVFAVRLEPSPGAGAGIEYFLEVSSTPAFDPATTVVYPLGGATAVTLNLGNQTRYFRARARYPSSDWSAYTWLGTAAAPVAVSGGVAGSDDLAANAPSNAVNNATVDSVDAGNGTATVRVYGPGGPGSSWQQSYGAGTRSFPAGTLAGLAYQTSYTVVWDTATGSYRATTSLAAAVADSYVFVGRVTTVAPGGSGGSTGGGGSGWSSAGCAEVGTPLELPAGARARLRLAPCSDWVELALADGRRLRLAPGTLVSVFVPAERLRTGALVETRTGLVRLARRRRQRRPGQKMVLRVEPDGVYWAAGVRVHNFKLI